MSHATTHLYTLHVAATLTLSTDAAAGSYSLTKLPLVPYSPTPTASPSLTSAASPPPPLYFFPWPLLNFSKKL
uniref:Uncharacterized protein n=1 Tax=Cucumis melo TaxID=3656 RepID=A0A9I9DTA2_CUCME